jgi:hypothetical protein
MLSTLVLRKSGVTSWLAVGLGSAMSAIPFHWWRIEHQSLSLLISVPLGIYLALLVNDGEYELLARDWIKYRKNKGIVKNKYQALFKLLLLPILISQLGLYFAFFSAALIAIAGFRRFALSKKSQILILNMIPSCLIATGLFVSFLPSLLVRDSARHIVRQPIESIVYSGQLMDSIVPSSTSLFPGANFFAQELSQVNSWANAVGSLGVRLTSNQGTLFTLLGTFFLILWALGFIKVLPALRENFSLLLTGVIFVSLTMIPFGFSVFLSTVISPQIRAWDRMIPFLQFLLIASFGVLLESIYGKNFQKWKQFQNLLLTGGILLVIVLDSALPARVAIDINKNIGEQKIAEARQVTGQISQITGTNCAILQLPFIVFPESAPKVNLGVYEPLWLGLAGKENNWSYGGIQGSKQGNWLEKVSSDPGKYESELSMYNFCGITLDARGYLDDELRSELRKLERDFGKPIVIHDGDFYVFQVKS